MNSSDAVIETQLQNRLGLLLRPDHSAPLVSVWTWYRVGSRNERPGLTGVSHWVEHMQFKGTPDLAKGQIFAEVSRVGGTLNALTSMDWTAYFETLPSSALELPLRIESDRMANSLFDVDEVESERTVILSERQGAMNNPGYLLYEAVLSEAFQRHSYRNMIIGSETDLQQMSREDLFRHYHRYYQPANAFLVAVGDFEPDALLVDINRAFGHLSNVEDAAPPSLPPREPAQQGERRVLLHRPAGVPYFRMAFHVPSASHPDFVPLLVADALLSGGKSMGFSGGGGMGRSSRLYRALVASGLARAATSDLDLTVDPFLFQITATGLPGSDLFAIEAAVDREIEALRAEAVPQAELERAVKQVEAQFVYSSEGVTNQAFWLGQWKLLGNWQRALTLPEEVRAVSSTDVQRVARDYFRGDRRVVGWLEPTDTAESSEGSAPKRAPVGGSSAQRGGDGISSSNESSQPFARALTDGGVVILGQERPKSRSVSLRLRVPAGAIFEPSNKSGLAYLTAKSLLRGSAGQSFTHLNEQTDRLGSSMTADASREYVELRVRCLDDDLPEMIALLTQTLLSPDFDPGQIDLVRDEQLGAIAELDNDTRATADRIMRRAVYPVPNPMGRRVLGSAEFLASLGNEDVASYWAKVLGSGRLTVAVVGALGGFERVVELISRALQGWKRSGRDQPNVDLSLLNQEVVRVTAAIPGKSQSDLALGIPTISRLDADYYALDIANHILGRQGLMGRLGAAVRDRQGLAYYASSQLEPRRDGSLWTARAGVDPGNIERALASIEAELANIRTAEVTGEELENAKSQLIGVLPLALETNDGVASTLLAIEEFDLGLDYIDRYPALIREVSRERCLEAAARHLDPGRLVVGVAEPASSPSQR